MVGWPEILKKENLTREEKKCICNRLMTTESHMEPVSYTHLDVYKRQPLRTAR